MLDQRLVLIGLVLLFIGIILIFVGSFASSKTDVKAAGGIFIGPFPIFGAFTDKRMFYILLIIAIAVFLIYYYLLRS